MGEGVDWGSYRLIIILLCLDQGISSIRSRPRESCKELSIMLKVESNICSFECFSRTAKGNFKVHVCQTGGLE
jgi:hypothetical protein